MADTTPPVNEVEEAKELLKKEEDAKLAKCGSELQQILDKYNCQLIVSMLVTPSANIPQITIATKTT